MPAVNPPLVWICEGGKDKGFLTQITRIGLLLNLPQIKNNLGEVRTADEKMSGMES